MAKRIFQIASFNHDRVFGFTRRS